MRNRKHKRGELLLTTLIDLLVQILFLFLLMIAVVSLNNAKSQQKAQEAQEAEKLLGIPLATIVEKWRRLVDPDQLSAEQKQFLAQKLDYERLKRLEAQLNEREKTLGSALGYRPCWGLSRKEIDSIFRIRLSDKGITVIKNWPPSRDTLATSLPIPDGSLDRLLGTDSFRAAFKGIYDSAQRDNCAHYVVIEDGTLSGEKSYEYLQAIEGYFYPLKKVRVLP